MKPDNNKFQGKYRIASARLKTWNYAWNGYYFVTICTNNRQNFFGNISNGKMRLNEYGEIAHKYWLEMPNHFDNIKIDAFVVMPNHVHGIIILKNATVSSPVSVLTTEMGTNSDFYSKISPKPKSLSTIIRSYKSICTKTINRTRVETLHCNVSTSRRNGQTSRRNGPIWQSGFYDHIIRNEKSFENIRKYIINNPAHWEKDENNFLQEVKCGKK